MKTIVLAIIAAPMSLMAQTIIVPATTIQQQPNGDYNLPAMTLNVVPAVPAAPIAIGAIPTTVTITSVEYKSGIHEVIGFNTGNVPVNYKVQFIPNDVLAIHRWSFRPRVAIVTIPFKIRLAQDTMPAKTIAGLTNIGLSVNLINSKWDRYFWNGNKTTHMFSAGVLIAPSADEVSPATTENKVKTTTNQMFISTGLTLTYSYGDISFIVVPIGFDIGMTNLAKKSIYNGKYWWGFGIGISSKLLGFQ